MYGGALGGRKQKGVIMANKTRTIDIELAIMYEFNFRQNLIVPNISSMMGVLPFETDMLVLTKSGMAYGFEIKTSKSDLKKDFKKPQHTKINLMLYHQKS